MKYIVILCDGMADEPLESLSGKTPLEAAKTLNMDRLAKKAGDGRILVWQKTRRSGWFRQFRKECLREAILQTCR